MKKNKDRSEDQAVLGVNMPKELRDRIRKIAEADRRGMAPWCVIQLEKAVEEIEAKMASSEPQPPPPQIASSDALRPLRNKRLTIGPKRENGDRV